jgi:hypothetical protein
LRSTGSAGHEALRGPLRLRADIDEQRPAADCLEGLGRPEPPQAPARVAEELADRPARGAERAGRPHHWPAISAAARTSRSALTSNRSMVVSGGE